MTPQERDLLDRCLQDLRRARPDRTDPEAQAMIAAALRDNPDAAYVLVQHAVVSDRALQEAGAHIEALEAELAERDGGADPGRGGGMFGGLFGGRRDEPRYGGPTAVPPTGGYGYGGPQAGYDPGRFGGGPFTGGGGLGGFLQQAGVAAAGVAGGAFLFQGLSNLFGGEHHAGHGLFGGEGERQGFFGEDGGRDLADGGAHDLFDGDTGGDDWG